MVWRVTDTGDRNLKLAWHRVEAALRELPGVDRLEPSTCAKPTLLEPRRVTQGEVVPPWLAFPEPPGSLRWRMGPGEDHITEWSIFFHGQLDRAGRHEYIRRCP